MIYTLTRTKIYYAKTQNILKNLNMVVFVYYHFKSNTYRRKLNMILRNYFFIWCLDLLFCITVLRCIHAVLHPCKRLQSTLICMIINTLEDIVVIFALKSSNFHFKLLGFFKACIKCRLIHKSIQDNYCFKIEEFLDL